RSAALPAPALVTKKDMLLCCARAGPPAKSRSPIAAARAFNVPEIIGLSSPAHTIRARIIEAQTSPFPRRPWRQAVQFIVCGRESRGPRGADAIQWRPLPVEPRTPGVQGRRPLQVLERACGRGPGRWPGP